MSIITLFNPNNPVSALNAQSASYYSESEKNISEKFKNIKQFEPPIDFTSASAWCHYGSLELYYEYGFKKVYQTYPYDGSAYEKNVYRNNASQIDNYVFDKLYPKSTGYAVFMPGAFVQAAYQTTSANVVYYTHTTPEYITTFGGPHTASAGMEGKPLHETFDDSNKYEVALRRESNLEFDFTYGNTIEFWMNKGTFLNTDGTEVVFHLSNGLSPGNTGYGSLSIELDPTVSASPFRVWVTSGSNNANFTLGSNITTANLPTDGWHHYAFAFINSGSHTRVNFFYDGNLTEVTSYSNVTFGRVTGSLKSSIGSLVGPHPQIANVGLGDGQFSGSLDEFRYWKYGRPADLVKLNYFKGVDGGTNTDDESHQLGVYYKFNEGITQTASVDSSVLDYSGRISNGVWTGYSSDSRNTGSAITLSGIETEVGDPIVRSSHPTVVSDMETYRLTGSYYDQENNTYFYNLFPQWIREEDLEESGLLKELAHIGASYFDTIHHQIKFYKDMKNPEYLSSSAKPLTFADSLVENMGLTVPNLFINPKIYEKVLNQDENELYDMTMFDVKNQIYHNIYNNIHSILKSKGTVSAMRNFLRSFGVNEEIIKLRMYTDKDTYFLNDNYKLETKPIKFVNFYNADNLGGSVIQTSSGSSDINYTEFSETTNEKYSSFTMEANVLFPKSIQPGENGNVGMNDVSSSIFGFHRPHTTDTTDYTWQDSAPAGLSNLQVYAVKDLANSKKAFFRLRDSDSSPTIDLQSPGLFQSVYDNSTWNISVRIKPSGSVFLGYYSTTSPDYILEFYGANYHNGEQRETFYLSHVLTGSDQFLLNCDKRFYVGAHTTNFTGSVLTRADCRVSAFRLWHSYLSNDELNSHAKDFSSYGVLSSSQNPTLFENAITSYFPKMDSLALNWNFEAVTGSDSSGKFLVYDISSGSAGGLTQYGWHSGSIGVRHGGEGINFLESSTKVTDKDYMIVAKSPEPGNALLDDMINIRPEFREAQTDYNDVTDNFFSIEKSPYAVLSNEMLKYFSLSRDLNYLIGNPSNRYRMEYKELGDLKDIYFRNVENEPDVERYFDYYKWIDLSFNQMINQLIPFSTRHSENVSNVIESHVLERPKYRAIMPFLERKTATHASIQGVAALNYDWKTGHAPAPRLSQASATAIADRNLTYFRFDAQSSHPNTATLVANFPSATPSITTTGTFMFSFWFYTGNAQPNAANLITFKDGSANTLLDVTVAQNTLNPDSVNLGLIITNPATGGWESRGDTSPYQQNSLLEDRWYHVSIFVTSHATNSGNMSYELHIDGSEMTTFGLVNSSAPSLGAFLITPSSMTISQIAMSVHIDEFVLLHRISSSPTAAAAYSAALYNNRQYYNVVDAFSASSGNFQSIYLLSSWRFGDEEGNTYWSSQSTATLDGQQILDVTANNNHLSVTDPDGTAHILNGAILTGPPFHTGTPPLAPGATTGADSPNTNCYWQKARKERTGTNSVNREQIRKVVNDAVTFPGRWSATSSLYDIQSAAIYEGSTFIRKSLNKPYRWSFKQAKTIHAGINYANNKNKILFHNALEPHGFLGTTATSVPQNIIAVGMGVGDGIVSTADCDDNILTKVNYSTNAMLGKYYADEYKSKMKGHSILPMNLKNETVFTGYNSQVNNLYKYDVVFTNLHTDTIDNTNMIPMQGPFTETHVGGHQSRHVPINRWNDDMPTADYLEVPSSSGGQSSGVLIFDISALTVGDTITIKDTNLFEIVAQYSSYYDIESNRWTTVDELVYVIETKLDISCYIYDLSPARIQLLQNTPGTGGDQAITTSNSSAITVAGMSGGSAPTWNYDYYPVDSRVTRPEAWGILMKAHSYLNTDPDAVFGFVGADYGPTYPYTSSLRATRFRDEHAKRPVNVRNIHFDSSSAFVGNYRRGLEIVQIPRDTQKRWFREAHELGLVLPSFVRSSMPITTHYQTLVGQQPSNHGNVFGHYWYPNTTYQLDGQWNNRQWDSDAFSNPTQASLTYVFNTEIASGTHPAFYVGESQTFPPQIKLERQNTSTLYPDIVQYNFAENVANGARTNTSPGTAGDQADIDVLIVADDWASTIDNFIDANDAHNDLFTMTKIESSAQAALHFFVQSAPLEVAYLHTSVLGPDSQHWNTVNYPGGAQWSGGLQFVVTDTNGDFQTYTSHILTSHDRASISTYQNTNTIYTHTTVSQHFTSIGVGQTKYLSPWQDFDNIEGETHPIWDPLMSDYQKAAIVMQSIVDCINYMQGATILAELIQGAPTFYESNLYSTSGHLLPPSDPQPTYPLNRYIRLTQLVPGFNGNRGIQFFKPLSSYGGPQDWTKTYHCQGGIVSYNTVTPSSYTPAASTVAGNPVGPWSTHQTAHKFYAVNPREYFFGGNINTRVVITEHLTGSSANGGQLTDLNQSCVGATSTTTNTPVLHPVTGLALDNTTTYSFTGGTTTPANDNVIAIPRTDLTSSTYEINTRFSAPGGPEVQTIGYLDAQTQTFSVHNAMPWRNLTVRGRSSGEGLPERGPGYAALFAAYVYAYNIFLQNPSAYPAVAAAEEAAAAALLPPTIRCQNHLPDSVFEYAGYYEMPNSQPTYWDKDTRGLRTLLQERMGKAGTDHRYSSGTGIGGATPLPVWTQQSGDYPIIGSYHKVHPNARYVLKAQQFTDVSPLQPSPAVSPQIELTTHSNYVTTVANNPHVTSPIPSQDYNYSWINSSFGQLTEPLSYSGVATLAESIQRIVKLLGFQPLYENYQITDSTINNLFNAVKAAGLNSYNHNFHASEVITVLQDILSLSLDYNYTEQGLLDAMLVNDPSAVLADAQAFLTAISLSSLGQGNSNTNALESLGIPKFIGYSSPTGRVRMNVVKSSNPGKQRWVEVSDLLLPRISDVECCYEELCDPEELSVSILLPPIYVDWYIHSTPWHELGTTVDDNPWDNNELFENNYKPAEATVDNSTPYSLGSTLKVDAQYSDGTGLDVVSSAGGVVGVEAYPFRYIDDILFEFNFDEDCCTEPLQYAMCVYGVKVSLNSLGVATSYTSEILCANPTFSSTVPSMSNPTNNGTPVEIHHWSHIAPSAVAAEWYGFINNWPSNGPNEWKAGDNFPVEATDGTIKNYICVNGSPGPGEFSRTGTVDDILKNLRDAINNDGLVEATWLANPFNSTAGGLKLKQKVRGHTGNTYIYSPWLTNQSYNPSPNPWPQALFDGPADGSETCIPVNRSTPGNNNYLGDFQDGDCKMIDGSNGAFVGIDALPEAGSEIFIQVWVKDCLGNTKSVGLQLNNCVFST